MSPFAAECLGTLLLILLGNGVVANVLLERSKGHGGGWIVITAGWAMAVFAGVSVAAPYSGAHLNPAVSIALLIAGKMQAQDLPVYIAGQLLGAALGAVAVWAVYRQHFARTKDADAKLACFCTGPAIRNPWSNLLSEFIGAWVLVIVVLYFSGPVLEAQALPDAKLGLGSLGALPVALLVWGIGLSLGGTTGYAINPARDLSPRIMHSILPIPGKRNSDWRYSWIPVLGPVAGAACAAALYLALG